MRNVEKLEPHKDETGKGKPVENPSEAPLFPGAFPTNPGPRPVDKTRKWRGPAEDTESPEDTALSGSGLFPTEGF
jgi:hypothetical protein